MRVNNSGNSGCQELVDARGNIVTLKNVSTVAINRFTLTIENVVIFENIFANLGVTGFNLTLRAGNGSADQF